MTPMTVHNTHESIDFNDFSFWRRRPVDLNEQPSSRDTSPPQTTPQDDAGDDLELHYWRRRPHQLVGAFNEGTREGTPVSMDEASVSPSESSSAPSPTNEDATQETQQETRAERGSSMEEDEMEGHGGDDRTAQLLAGGAGARLLGVLGQLTQHLGRGNSRFAAASSMLQRDLEELRSQARDAEADQMDSPAARLFPPPSSYETLQQPQVMSSMSSMLQLLGDDVSLEPMWSPTRGARPPPDRHPRPAAMPPPTATMQQAKPTSRANPTDRAPVCARAVLAGSTENVLEFSLAELASPSNPASPQAVRHLLDNYQLDVTAMEAEFHLDGHGPPPPGVPTSTPAASCCPICLEVLVDEARNDAVLQMPCAKQHVFHRACLLQWLHDNNSCPVRRATAPPRPAPPLPHPLNAPASRGQTLRCLPGACDDRLHSPTWVRRWQVCRHCLPTQDDEAQVPP